MNGDKMFSTGMKLMLALKTSLL